MLWHRALSCCLWLPNIQYWMPLVVLAAVLPIQLPVSIPGKVVSAPQPDPSEKPGWYSWKEGRLEAEEPRLQSMTPIGVVNIPCKEEVQSYPKLCFLWIFNQALPKQHPNLRTVSDWMGAILTLFFLYSHPSVYYLFTSQQILLFCVYQLNSYRQKDENAGCVAGGVSLSPARGPKLNNIHCFKYPALFSFSGSPITGVYRTFL